MVATKSGRQRDSPPSGDGSYQKRPATRESTFWRWWLPKAAGNERVHLLAMVATKSGRQRDSPPSGDGGYQTNPGNETIHLLAMVMVAKKKWPSGQNNRGDWIRTSDLYVPNVAKHRNSLGFYFQRNSFVYQFAPAKCS